MGSRGVGGVMRAAGRAVRGALSRLRSLGERGARAERLDEEMAFHVEMLTERHERAGLSPAEARRAALRDFGGRVRHAEAARDEYRSRLAEDAGRDVRHGLRQLARTPVFTIVAVLTIAVGIGVNAAMFGLVDGILLRPLPYAAPEELVRVHQASLEHGVVEGEVSAADFDDWRERTRAFSSMALYRTFTSAAVVEGQPLELETVFAGLGFFETLGVGPFLGRLLVEDDHRQSARVAVLSHRSWTRHFGGDPGAIGRTFSMDVGGSDEPITIVGVAGASFVYPDADADAWVPKTLLTADDIGPRVRHARLWLGLARLAPGVTAERAHADLNAVTAQLAAEFPESNAEWGTGTVVPLKRAMVGHVDRALLIVLGAVGFVLLIASANLANLLLARGAGRAREMAVRAALGARRGRLVRQLMTESALLGLAGGVVGIVLAFGVLQGIVALSADTLPRMEAVSVDGRVMGFGLLLALLTSALFGLLPALRLAEAAPQEQLRGGRGAVGAGGGRLRRGLVVAEVSLAVVLVIAGGLMARSFLELRGVDPGFEAERVLTVTLRINTMGVPPGQGSLTHLLTHLHQRRNDLVERAAALPGVQAAASTTRLPIRAEGEATELVRPEAPDATPVRVQLSFVTPDYFRVLGIPLVRGEPVPAEPTPGAPLQIVVSETTARLLWADEDPVGRTVMTSFGGPYQVAGVVGDVRQAGLDREAPAQLYFPAFFGPRTVMTLVLRTAGDPIALATPVRQAIHEIDPGQSISSMTTMRGIVSESVARDRFFTLLFGVFGGLALGLAALGIYGVLAYSVSRRTQEIGVRMALGARPSDVRRMVVRDGMVLVAAGLVIGTGAGLLLTRLLESLLHGITPTDPISIAASLGVLTAIALLASYLPSRRATRVHPTLALRSE
jgi:predicted permease